MVASPTLGDLQETHQRLETREQLLPVDPAWEFPNELSWCPRGEQANQAVEVGTHILPSDDEKPLRGHPFDRHGLNQSGPRISNLDHGKLSSRE